MTRDDALRAGGWDPRYAVVRAVLSDDDIAAYTLHGSRAAD